jgi:predicted tellurium resistance membrane protein TerC
MDTVLAVAEVAAGGSPWIALATLTVLEIVLGIDNVIFISILAAKLPVEQQARARRLGLSIALVARVLLLLSLSWVVGLKADLFSVWGHGISGRDLILLGGGLFLIFKSTAEIHHKLEGVEGSMSAATAPSFRGVLIQILLLDIVFSLDSVITAVGMASQLWVMIVAVILAMVFMLGFAGTISAFVERHPTVKMLALSFLLLIGTALIAEGFDHAIPKGYIYFAMAFSVFVEVLNIRLFFMGPRNSRPKNSAMRPMPEISPVRTTSVPPAQGTRTWRKRNSPFFEEPSRPSTWSDIARGGSNSVTSKTSAASRPNILRTSRKRLPTRSGPSLSRSTRTKPCIHRSNRSGSASAAKTRSGGAATVRRHSMCRAIVPPSGPQPDLFIRARGSAASSRRCLRCRASPARGEHVFGSAPWPRRDAARGMGRVVVARSCFVANPCRILSSIAGARTLMNRSGWPGRDYFYICSRRGSRHSGAPSQRYAVTCARPRIRSRWCRAWRA